ncbi:MAG: S-layer homology domain-containing protein [Dehalobacter sp.]|nr:S-layer homology domain-containing protein [Dehalobacter sp.]
MFTLLYNALKVIGQLPGTHERSVSEADDQPQGDSGNKLSGFSDAGQIDSWAKKALTLLVDTGTVSGNAGKLSPTSTTTRAEMAQVLYNLLGK